MLNAGASTSCLDNHYTDDLRNLTEAACDSEDQRMINDMVDDISIEDISNRNSPVKRTTAQEKKRSPRKSPTKRNASAGPTRKSPPRQVKDSATGMGREKRTSIEKKIADLNDKMKMQKKTGAGRKRKGGNYGLREGQSLVGTYRSTLGKNFCVWHCKRAFEEGYDCVDGVCSRCKMDSGNNEHACGECGQKLSSYKCEDDQRMMGRCRKNWEGPGPENCAICCIEL